MNLNYENIYKQWRFNPTTPMFSSPLVGAATRRFEPPFQKEIEARYFERFPRRKVFNTKKVPSDIVEEVVAKWRKRAAAWAKAKVTQKLLLTQLLIKEAPNADLTPVVDEREIDSCAESTYGSQGLGARRYAHGDMAIREAQLKNAGFSARIEERRWNGGHLITYVLHANATKWQYDAVQRLTTPEEKGTIAESLSLNPRVYNPFLAY